MPFPQTRLVLSLALVLLWPATAFAQTPAGPFPASARQVQIKVVFATVSTADLVKSGISFDHVPFPPSPTASAAVRAIPASRETFLQYAVSSTAPQLFQILVRTRGQAVQAPLITTTDNVPATIAVATQVPSPAGQAGTFLTMQAGLTILPRTNRDDSISMRIAMRAADGDVGTLTPVERTTSVRTVRSGDMMALRGLSFSNAKPINGKELLVFVTPVILGTDGPGMDEGQPDLSFPLVQGTAPAAGRTVSMDVYDADLRAVVATLVRQTGLKASVLGSVGAYNPVYVHLNGASRAEVLGAIARSAGAQIIQDENGVYVFSPLPGAARTPNPATAIPSPSRRKENLL